MTTNLPANRRQPATPYEVDEALVNSLAASVDRACQPQYNTDFDVIGYRWVDYDNWPIPTPDDIAAALDLVNATLKPCPPAVVKRELTWLRAVTVSREATTEDWLLRLTAYAEELVRYPEDVVIATVRHCGRTNRFWPALAELMSECNSLMRRRHSLRNALLYPPKPPPPPPTEEEIKLIEAKMREAGIRQRERRLHQPRPVDHPPLTVQEQKEKVVEWCRVLNIDPTEGAARCVPSVSL
jgi:hypothetical protein